MEKKTNKNKRKIKELYSNLHNKNLINIVLLVIFTAMLFFITIYKFEGYKLKVRVGDFAESDIRATKELNDEYATNKLKEKAANEIIPRYRIFPSVQMNMKENISGFFDEVKDLKLNSEISNNGKIQILSDNLRFKLSNNDLAKVLNMEYKALNQFESTLIDLTNQLMGIGIKEEDLAYEKENLKSSFESLNLSEEEKSIGLSIMEQIITPNKFIDEVETERMKEEAVDRVQPVIIKENQIIALKGELIDHQKYELIKESGLLKDNNQNEIGIKIGIGLLLILSVSLLYGYIYLFNKTILDSNKFLVLLLIMLMTIFISGILYSISPYIMPVASGALLISILIEPQLGVIVNLFISLFLGFLLRLDVNIVSMLAVGGSLGILSLNNQKQRYNILIDGIAIGIINAIVLTSFGLIKSAPGRDIFLKDILGFVNGIIAIIITIGTLPLWENMFSILTPMKLLELSNPNHPLLRKLLLEAPGTYHHSLMVGNLSEAAAESIGANPLLTRVGAYYHDIGKVKRPYYFKENQFGMENPHDKLDPYESANIILSHPIDGIQMAMEKRLPKEIISFIDQHHGTTTVAYFYYKAKEKDENADINDFKYKGKKPQSKETAIVMLADSVEAAVRSIKEPTKEKIEDMVSKVIQSKINEEQLNECDITNKDIQIIKDTFLNVLMGIYHDRIEYPNMENLIKEG